MRRVTERKTIAELLEALWFERARCYPSESELDGKLDLVIADAVAELLRREQARESDRRCKTCQWWGFGRDGAGPAWGFGPDWDRCEVSHSGHCSDMCAQDRGWIWTAPEFGCVLWVEK